MYNHHSPWLTDACLETALVTTRKADGTTFGRVGQSVSVCVSVCLCVCLSVCPVRALSFESLDLETSFLVRRYICLLYTSPSPRD